VQAEAEFNMVERRIKFHKISVGYNVGIDIKHLREVTPDLEGWDVTVGRHLSL